MMIPKRYVFLLGCATTFLTGWQPARAVDLTGAGATFPQPIYQRWFESYKKVNPQVSFNYQGVGSGTGQKQIISQTVDFGASDAPMSDANLAQAPGKILHLPTVAGAVVLIFNLPGTKALKLDGPTVADIYLGKVTKWNDKAIAGQNPGVKLPDANIAVVHRADGSGTSFIFTDYLSSISPEWKSKVGANTSVNWPVGVGGPQNPGVTNLVKQTPNSIGYVELIYAISQKLGYADLKNAEGKYVKASLESVTDALAGAQIPEDFRFSIVNAPGASSYPICGATWLLVYQQSKDAAKGQEMVKFLKWALTDGEKMAKSMDYAPLPDAVQKRVLERIDTIK